MELSFYILLL